MTTKDKVLKYLGEHPAVLADIIANACVHCRLTKELEYMLDIPPVTGDETCKRCPYNGTFGCEHQLKEEFES